MDKLTILTILFQLAYGGALYLLDLRFKHSVSKQLEKYKNELSTKLVDHQVKFTRLNEKQVEAIEGLYARMLMLKELIESYYQEELENSRKVFDAHDDFVAFHMSKAIYLSSEMNDKVNAFSKSVIHTAYLTEGIREHSAASVLMRSYLSTRTDIELSEDSLQELIYTTIPQLAEDLKAEMRNILGVNG